MWPIAYAAHQTVLHRIDMTILDVSAEILLVADQMFPKSTLPDAPFATLPPNLAAPLGLGNGLSEADFYQPPTQREIGVARRQRPNRVDMFGQYHHRVDRKRVAHLDDAHCLAQGADILRQKAASPVQEIDGEEPASPRYESATIIRHTDNDKLSLTDATRPAALNGVARSRTLPWERRNALRLLRPTRFDGRDKAGGFDQGGDGANHAAGAAQCAALIAPYVPSVFVTSKFA
jgi:hypothetical protein